MLKLCENGSNIDYSFGINLLSFRQPNPDHLFLTLLNRFSKLIICLIITTVNICMKQVRFSEKLRKPKFRVSPFGFGSVRVIKNRNRTEIRFPHIPSSLRRTADYDSGETTNLEQLAIRHRPTHSLPYDTCWRRSSVAAHSLPVKIDYCNAVLHGAHLHPITSPVFNIPWLCVFCLYKSILSPHCMLFLTFMCVSYMLKHVIDIGWRSVCLSVCPSHAGTVSKRLNILSSFLHHTIAHSF